MLRNKQFIHICLQHFINESLKSIQFGRYIMEVIHRVTGDHMSLFFKKFH